MRRAGRGGEPMESRVAKTADLIVVLIAVVAAVLLDLAIFAFMALN
jgi:hypothetical protein